MHLCYLYGLHGFASSVATSVMDYVKIPTVMLQLVIIELVDPLGLIRVVHEEE